MVRPCFLAMILNSFAFCYCYGAVCVFEAAYCWVAAHFLIFVFLDGACRISLQKIFPHILILRFYFGCSVRWWLVLRVFATGDIGNMLLKRRNLD